MPLRSGTILLLALATEIGLSPRAHASPAPPSQPTTVDGWYDLARSIEREADALAEARSTRAAASYAAAAAADADALLLERETSTTYDRRHLIFCHASKAWLKSFEHGLADLGAVQQAIDTANAYDTGLAGYTDRDARETDCKVADLFTAATRLKQQILDSSAGPAPSAVPGTRAGSDYRPTPDLVVAIEPGSVVPPPVLDTRPRDPQRPRPYAGLLATFGVLSLGGAIAAISLGAKIHASTTLEDSGSVYRDLSRAVEDYVADHPEAAVPPGGDLCTAETRMNLEVAGLCDRARRMRAGMIASAAISGLFIVGTGVMAGLLGAHQRRSRRVHIGAAAHHGIFIHLRAPF